MPPPQRDLGPPQMFVFDDRTPILPSPMHTPPSSFPLFSKLPAELRIRIWEHSIQDVNRFVSIHCGADMPATEPEPQDLDHSRQRQDSSGTAVSLSSPFSFHRTPDTNVCASNSPIPSQLHVCSESRAVALSLYTLSFSYCGQRPNLYFKPDTDILYFGPRDGYRAAYSQLQSFLLTVNPYHLARVQRIAVDDSIFCGETNTEIELLRAISNVQDVTLKMYHRMPRLKEVIFMPRAGYYPSGTSIDDYRTHLQDRIQTAINGLARQKGHAWVRGGPRYIVSKYPMTSSVLTSRSIADIPGDLISVKDKAFSIPNVLLGTLASLRAPRDEPILDWQDHRLPAGLSDLVPHCSCPLTDEEDSLAAAQFLATTRNDDGSVNREFMRGVLATNRSRFPLW